MQTHLICYADSNMTISQQLCMKSAEEVGKIEEVFSYGPDLIDTQFYKRNKNILEADQRGGGKGFWLWKPYIVDTHLRLMDDGDTLIYCDSGVEWVQPLASMTGLISNNEIVLFGNEHRHLDWCKSEVLLHMLPEHNYNIRNFPYKALQWKQAQASVIIMRVNEYTREFASRWLAWSCIPGFIDDKTRCAQLPEFSAHRNDQSILTNLAIADNIKLHWWPAQYGHRIKNQYPGDNYPQMFYHHRRRNTEWVIEMQKLGLSMDQAIQRFMNQPKHI